MRWIACRDPPIFADQGDFCLIARQAVEIRAMKGDEGLQPAEMSDLFECLGIERQGQGSGVDPGASTGAFLGRAGMWRAVGAEEKARIARGGRFQHGAAVAFRLEHGQAVIMGP